MAAQTKRRCKLDDLRLVIETRKPTRLQRYTVMYVCNNCEQVIVRWKRNSRINSAVRGKFTPQTEAAGKKHQKLLDKMDEAVLAE